MEKKELIEYCKTLKKQNEMLEKKIISIYEEEIAELKAECLAIAQKKACNDALKDIGIIGIAGW